MGKVVKLDSPRSVRRRPRPKGRGAPRGYSLPGARLVVADGEAGQKRLEARLDRAAGVRRVGLEPAPLDVLAASDDLVDEIGMLIAEERPDRVKLGIHERLKKRAGGSDV